MRALRKAAGLEQWPENCLRHSFASYHLAVHGDAVKTAAQLGHMSVKLIHDHYKALVLKFDSEKFWALRPQTPS
jgi:integrase